ncbi:hypothetical protein [Aquimarina algiphila]|uniref:Uncharacterized protein n=1 Tax=Aquimarina algiphila TaxID=2047982 RepID=A0A554VBZ3_9FLAO|nr:hypothetical protein [Aquimarina algiphila]TSE04143.1 hypothetical protein FOF46_27275 [Aquimarina algiphila]
MWISVKENLIEERFFELKTGNCSSGNVVLQLIRRDTRISFFLFPKKITNLICQDTGKRVKKSQWSTEIVKTAEEMKRNLKVPSWGYWSFGIIALTILLAVPIGFYLEVKDSIGATRSFMTENNQQKKFILQTLDIGDLVATSDKVYIISEMTDKHVKLIESEIPAKPENYTEGLSNEEYPAASFTGEEIQVLRIIFVTARVSNTDQILNILDN